MWSLKIVQMNKQISNHSSYGVYITDCPRDCASIRIPASKTHFEPFHSGADHHNPMQRTVECSACAPLAKRSGGSTSTWFTGQHHTIVMLRSAGHVRITQGDAAAGVATVHTKFTTGHRARAFDNIHAMEFFISNPCNSGLRGAHDW